jgi:hypothetical protein
VRTIITDGTDSDTVAGLVEQIISTLQRLDRDGVPVVTAHELWEQCRSRDNFKPALRAAIREGRVRVRRVHVGGGRRRRYIALPHNAELLPGGAL